MDVIYPLGRATAAEVRTGLPDPPSYSAVRALLRLLEEKGHLTHVQEGPRYVFIPTTSRTKAAQSALERLVTTFFEGSVESMVSTLIDSRSQKLSDEELDRIAAIIDAARKEGR